MRDRPKTLQSLLLGGLLALSMAAVSTVLPAVSPAVLPAALAQTPETPGNPASSKPAPGLRTQISPGASDDGGEPGDNAGKQATKPGKDLSGKHDWRKTALPPDKAYAAFQRGYFVTAFKEAMQRIEAEAPDAAAAMTLIAELYRDGLGFKKDTTEATRWYSLAAKRGNAQAAFALGRAYLDGEGIAKDHEKAKQLFEEAAGKGDGQALYNLGIMAMEPIEDGKPADFKSAASLFDRASEAGNLDASYSLALLYRSGRGVKKDEKKAVRLLRKAAEQHHLVAMTEYSIALFNGKGVKKDEAAAARFMIKAAWRNSPVAQNRLARMYAAGRGVKRDMVQAMKWHIIARASGVKDQWLEDQLPFLTRTQRKIVNEQVRKFAGK